MGKKENLKMDKNQEIHPIAFIQPKASIGKTFLFLFITILVTGLIIGIGFLFYYSVIGEIILPQYVLCVFASTICVSIFGAFHILLKALFQK